MTYFIFNINRFRSKRHWLQTYLTLDIRNALQNTFSVLSFSYIRAILLQNQRKKSYRLMCSAVYLYVLPKKNESANYQIFIFLSCICFYAFANDLSLFFSFSLSSSDKYYYQFQSVQNWQYQPSIASYTILLLISDLYPNAFITHMFSRAYIFGDLIDAFIRSAISLAPLSCDFDKTSRKILANVISLFSMIFKLQAFQQLYHFIDGSWWIIICIQHLGSCRCFWCFFRQLLFLI